VSDKLATETDSKGLPTLSNAGPMAFANSPSKSNVLAVRFLFVSAMRPCSTEVVCQRAAMDSCALSMESTGLPVLPFKKLPLVKRWGSYYLASSCVNASIKPCRQHTDANSDGFTLDLYRC